MAKFRRSSGRPGDEAYPGRFGPMDPAQAAKILNGPRMDHRGQTWEDHNNGWSWEDWEDLYDRRPDEPPVAPPGLEWRGPEYTLPHVREQIDQHNEQWADYDDENSLHNSFWPKVSQQTAIRQHGETRYGLDIGDEGFDIGGWLWHWRLHRQTGPDVNNPEHWEQLSSLPGAPTADTAYDPEHAKAHAEQALDDWLKQQAKSRPAIGDYDLDEITRQHGGPNPNPGPNHGLDDDYGDIFGKGR
jgi:hypothetical protein